MKVLVIPSWYPPNGGYFFREHAFAIAEQGPKVDVLACHYRSLKSWKGRSRLFGKKPIEISKINGITEYSSYVWIIPFTEEPNFRCWVKKTWKIFHEYIKVNGKPDIIQAHSSFSAGYVASLIFKAYKIPYILTEHRSRFIFNCNTAKSLFRSWHYPLIKQALDDCSSLVGVSNALFPKLHEISPKSKNKSLVIHNMVDTDFFTFDKTKKNIKSESQFKFITVAFLKEVKGIDVLLKAFNILHESNPGKYQLTIAGDGECRKELEQYVNDNRLNEYVEFLGLQNRDQIKKLMQSSDAFVLPSRFEAFGVVFIEAMACGLPVIATRAGGPETFIPEFAGKLCEIDNVNMLASQMKEIASNYNNYQGEQIREYAIANFSKEIVAKKYINLYSTAIEENNS
ncbi:MAG: glycosyltransferase [Bacteroidota bacterium]